jgi:ankyrin repeat protein
MPVQSLQSHPEIFPREVMLTRYGHVDFQAGHLEFSSEVADLRTHWGTVACCMSLEKSAGLHIYIYSLFVSLQVDLEQAKSSNRDEATEEEELDSPGNAHDSTSKRNFTDLLLDDSIMSDGDAAVFDDDDVDKDESKEEEEEELEPKIPGRNDIKSDGDAAFLDDNDTNKDESKEEEELELARSPGNTAHEELELERIPGISVHVRMLIASRNLLDDDIQSDDGEIDFFFDDEAIPTQAAIGIKAEADEPIGKCTEDLAEVNAETEEEGTKENKKGGANKVPEDTKEEDSCEAKKAKTSKKGNSAKEEASSKIDETPDWLFKGIDDDNEAKVFAKKYTKDMQRDHAFSTSLSDTFLGKLKKTIHRDSANELFKLLNRNPLSESNSFSDNAVTAFLLEHPEVCAVRYAFEAFNEPIYPLSMLCTLRPSAYAVQLCFEAYEDAIDSKDTWVGAPLHYACAFGASKDVVDYLTMNENDCVRFINRRKQIPLHLACGSQCSKEVAALLIAEYPMTLEMADEECMMPLHRACDNGADLELVKELIPEYPLACIAQTKYGATPLHIAVARRAPFPVLKVLVKGHDAALKVVDDRGRTPLHIAVLVQADFKTMKLLAKKKALKKKNSMGQTPFEVAETMADATFANDVMKLLKNGKGE